MIRQGRVLLVGDEAMGVLGNAAGVEVYVFRGNCRELVDRLKENASLYDVLIYLNEIAEQCRELKTVLDVYFKNKLLVELEHPLKERIRDPKTRYREMARRDLGVEIEL